MTRPLLALLALALVGCSGCAIEGEQAQELSRSRYEIIQIRECEYIYAPWFGEAPPIHAGDCRNPIHTERPVVNDTIWRHTWIGPNTSHGPDSVHTRWTGRIDGCIDAETLRGRTAR